MHGELAKEAGAVLQEKVLREEVSYPCSVKPPGGKGRPMPWRSSGGMEVVRWDRGKPASAICLHTRNELEDAGDEDKEHSCRLFLGKTRVTPSPKIEGDLTLTKFPKTGLRQDMTTEASWLGGVVAWRRRGL